MATSQQVALADTLLALRRRLLAVGLAAGAGYALVAALVFLAAWMWLDLALELTPGLRVTACMGAFVTAAVVFVIGAAWKFRQGGPLALARRLDRAAGASGQILTGADLAMAPAFTSSSGGAAAAALSPGLARLAVERAAELAAGVARPLAVPVRPLAAPMFSLAGITLTGIIVALSAPRLVSTQWLRFTDPFGDHPPYSRFIFEVQPGHVKVVYGEGLDVRVSVAGGIPERVELLLASPGRPIETLPMFPESSGRWRATVSNVIAPQEYFIRAEHARSHRYGISVLAVPRILDVFFRVTPPAYTRQSAYEGPLPQGGISGLPRTQVQVRVKSNRPLSGGMMEGMEEKTPGSGSGPQPSKLTSGGGDGAMRSTEAGSRISDYGSAGVLAAAHSEPPPVSLPQHTTNDEQRSALHEPGTKHQAPGTPADHSSAAASRGNAMRLRIPMHPGADVHEAVGTFEMSTSGKVAIRLRDIDGQESSETYTFPLTLLRDERPFIRILEPPADALATPDASVPVLLSAEDDHGLARVQLFRSLNDSRPRPADVAVPTPSPSRWQETAILPLGECGVAPGDVIKVFARVEDNDPDGAKGAESTFVTIRIIAQADFERLMRTREGLEVLTARYDMANRRLEALLEAIEQLEKELAESPPESEASREQRERLGKLAQQAADAARDVSEAARKTLPYDLDRKLSPELQKIAEQMKAAADEARKLSQSRGASVSALGKKLAELARKLGGQRKEFNEKALEPIRHLAAVFPLLEDQALFIGVYQRQRDLAERLASLRGRDDIDDPAVKVRMRDLEEEQRHLRDALGELLDRIDAHVATLPEDAELDELRETASKFSKAVRESEALDAMSSAEAGLAEFSGTLAHQGAKKAAEILEKFIGQCNGMGSCASSCMKFQPTLSSNMGNTVEQLLSDLGLSAGMAPGGGIGGGGGYSMQRSSLQNVGMYGNLPTRGTPTPGGRSGDQAATAGRGSGPGVRHESDPRADTGDRGGQAVGAANIDVPLQYRQKVGRYFERIADEIGDERRAERSRGR